MFSSNPGAARRAISALGPGIATALLIGWLCATRGGDTLAAISSCPPWVLIGAMLAHALTLVIRTETWRIALAAGGADRLSSRVLHAANAGAFLAGMVQSHAAMPARVALLRHIGGADAPQVSEIALADAPIFLLEVCTAALLAAIASTAVPSIPAWAPGLLLLGALATLWGLALAHTRFRHHPLAAGLAVLADPRLRARLIALVLALTATALLRTWLVLIGFGLPADPASAALLLFSLGAIGLLPLGLGAAPTATVAALGTANLASAAAAGLALSASTMLAVLLYAATCWMLGARFTNPVPVPESA
jgi:Lysylphosphatidylglycerol synthase TM region